MEQKKLILIACVVALLLGASDAKSLLFESKLDRNFTVLNEFDWKKHPSCKSVLQAGYNVSGVYRLHLGGQDVNLPCEFENGNAFTVILRRESGVQTFIMPWASYEYGFGHPLSNYWAGLANIWHLTQTGQNQLQINMQDWSGASGNAFYSHFYLEPRAVRYRLHISGFKGTVPDMLSYQNNMPFSTYDAPDPSGCASNMKAGWWYNYCAYALPTGIYYFGGHYHPTGSMYDGMFWDGWNSHKADYSLRFLSATLS